MVNIPCIYIEDRNMCSNEKVKKTGLIFKSRFCFIYPSSKTCNCEHAVMPKRPEPPKGVLQ